LGGYDRGGGGGGGGGGPPAPPGGGGGGRSAGGAGGRPPPPPPGGVGGYVGRGSAAAAERTYWSRAVAHMSMKMACACFWKIETQTLYVQPFSKKSRTPTVPRVFQICLCGVGDTDLDTCFNRWSAGFLRERLQTLWRPYIVFLALCLTCSSAVSPMCAPLHKSGCNPSTLQGARETSSVLLL